MNPEEKEANAPSVPDTPLAMLCRVRTRLENPKHWTKGAYARNANDVPTSEIADDAVCWCLLGVLYKEERDFGVLLAVRTLLQSQLPKAEKSDPFPISHFNDSSKHEEVLALIDKTIKVLS